MIVIGSVVPVTSLIHTAAISVTLVSPSAFTGSIVKYTDLKLESL